MNRGNDRLITFPSTTFCLVVQQQLQLLLRFLQFISGLLQLDHTSLLFSIATDSLRVEESITPFCCCTISLEFGVLSAVLSTKCAPRICHIDRLFWWRICVCVFVFALVVCFLSALLPHYHHSPLLSHTAFLLHYIVAGEEEEGAAAAAV